NKASWRATEPRRVSHRHACPPTIFQASAAMLRRGRLPEGKERFTTMSQDRQDWHRLESCPTSCDTSHAMNFLDLANPHQETLIIGKPRKKETPAPTHGRTRLPSSAPRVIGFVGLGAHARGLVPRVAGLLAKRSPVDVITDAPAAWQASSFPLQVLPARG